MLVNPLLSSAVAVKNLEGGDVSEEEFLPISDGKIALETLRCVFAGILTTLRLAVRAPSSLKADVRLGKLQPVACSRIGGLLSCISDCSCLFQGGDFLEIY